MQKTQLTPKEKKVLDLLLKKLRVPKRKTNEQMVIGMLGLVGSGKSTVGAFLAKEISAVVIDVDDIRVHLRKHTIGYEHAQEIALEIGKEVIGRDGNVVIASDLVDANKRNILKKITKDAHTRLHFIRVFAEHDTVIGRIIGGKYSASDLFGGAETAWKGKNKGAVVKLREMWRRTPHHHFWNSEEGGHWVIKTMPFIFAEIDTTDSKKWKTEMKRLATRLKQ